LNKIDKAKIVRLISIFIMAVSITVTAYALYCFYPSSYNDWIHWFSKLAANLSNPMNVEGFVNPPWTALFVLYGFLPIRISNVINLMINIVVLFLAIRYVHGGWSGILLTFTCPLFLEMARVNPIDWIPLLGFLLPTMWGLPLMAVKPQTLGAAILIKWKKENFQVKPVIPLIVVVILSFIVWGFWIPGGAGSLINQAWNFSFWPVSIPLGVYVLYKAWKEDDEILAGASSALFLPYIAPYSIVCLLSILSGKHKKIAIGLYFIIWWYMMVEGRKLGVITL
jgi:hypothetical protein